MSILARNCDFIHFSKCTSSCALERVFNHYLLHVSNSLRIAF